MIDALALVLNKIYSRYNEIWNSFRNHGKVLNFMLNYPDAELCSSVVCGYLVFILSRKVPSPCSDKILHL